MAIQHIILLWAAVSFSRCHEQLISVPEGEGINKYILYSYPDGVLSDSGLDVCESNMSACAVVHTRFWFPPKVQLLCRCDSGKECLQKQKINKNPKEDKKSMMLNNRAKLQFCGAVRHEEMAKCDAGLMGLTEGANHSSVQVDCYCPMKRYWRRKDGAYGAGSLYTCDKLQFCTTGDHCSNIRTDTYASYYRCTCPKNHMCLPKDDEPPQNVTELMYTGPAYRGYCTMMP